MTKFVIDNGKNLFESYDKTETDAAIKTAGDALQSTLAQVTVIDSIRKYTTNSKILNIEANSYYDRQYFNAGLKWSVDKKLLISLRLKPSVATTYYIAAIKPDQSGWVKTDITHKSFSANEEKVMNVLYTTTAECFITVRVDDNSAITGEIELYIYDITDYNGASDVELGTNLYKYGMAFNSNNAKFSDYANETEQANEAVDAYKLFTKKKTFNSHVTGQGWYRSIGFSGWQFDHTYLFVLDDDDYLAGDDKILGFLTSSYTWAERFQWTKHYSSGGGYVVCTPPNNAEPTSSPQLISDNLASLDINVTIYDITGLELTEREYDLIFRYGQDISAFNIVEYLFDNFESKVSDKLNNTWKGKNVLFIGDSLTEANTYQQTVVSNIGISYTNHCKGGYGIIQLIDGQGTFPALSVADVTGKDLIVLYAGYNNRSVTVGQAGDVYPTNSTIAGYMQYAINKIYELLATANNLTCHIMIVTVDCAGKYPWIDADGYTEYPAGSGQTMEDIANVQKAVADYNSLPCVDLWHNSGINKKTWSVFGRQADAYIDNPTEPDAPYPHNGDQLHKSAAGYKRIGECIVGGIIDAYGN